MRWQNSFSQWELSMTTTLMLVSNGRAFGSGRVARVPTRATRPDSAEERSL